HHTVLTLNEKLDAQKVNFANLTSEYERIKTRLEEELTQREALIDSVKSRFIEHPEFFIYVPSGNAYLGLKDEDEKLSIGNLKLVTDIRDALFLNYKAAAERVIEALDN